MPQQLVNEVPPQRPVIQGGPHLLVEWPAASRVFFGNLLDLLLFRESPQPWLSSRPAPFWPDVFVHRPVAWRSMASSALYHVFLVVAIWGFTVAWLQRAPLPTRSPFDNTRITYYSVSEYLPEIDTGNAPAKEEKRKGEPKLARQRIISVPRAPDNSRQTIVTPSQIKLPRDASLPNLVAWTPVPSPVPEAALAQTPARLQLPPMAMNVVAPPPDTTAAKTRLSASLTPEAVAPAPSTEALRGKSAPRMAAPEVIAAPPALETAKSGLRLPHLAEPSVVAPPVSMSGRPLAVRNAARLDPAVAAPVVPPAPSVTAVGNRKQAAGQLIALGLDPAAVNGPIEVPKGTRRGQFAATPEGNPNAPGTPDIKGGGTREEGGNRRGSRLASAPAGISVGPSPSQAKAVAQGDPANAPKADPLNQPRVMASLETSRLANLARDSRFSRSNLDGPGKIEDKIFGDKPYSSIMLNMPNLTSAGGSWVIRFAELNQSSSKGNITPPQPTLKVDPAYPAELMRDGVEGTVTLYAVIHKDGTVGQVRVLRGVEQRLDENARVALSRWKFRPAMKNGLAVDLEAVFQIPFAAGRMPF